MYQKLFIWVLICLIPVFPAAAQDLPTTDNGRKWVIGYYEGGPYIDYVNNLLATVDALMADGWIERAPLPRPSPPDSAKEVWNWLSTHVSSRYLSFPANAFVSANWNKESRAKCAGELVSRFQDQKDIDLMIAMGTWAGQDLAVSDHDTPVVVAATADPIRAGIIKSPYDSGLAHVHAKCDPTRYQRQLRLFHDIVQFKRLGLVFEDSEEGRIYANLEDVKLVAKERGFTYRQCHAPESDTTDIEARDGVKECWSRMAPEIDAVWITVHRGEDPRYMPGILEPLFTNKIPSWTRRGAD